jgi:hypothetical protein
MSTELTRLQRERDTHERVINHIDIKVRVLAAEREKACRSPTRGRTEVSERTEARRKMSAKERIAELNRKRSTLAAEISEVQTKIALERSAHDEKDSAVAGKAD